MNWMQFVASLVGSVAWPVVVLIVLFRFKAETKNLLQALLKLKLPGGIEAEFSKDLVNVRNTLTIEQNTAMATANPSGNVAGISGGNTSPPSLSLDVLKLIVSDPDPEALKANPTGVVMEAWKGLEAAIKLAGSKVAKSGELPKDLGARGVSRFLESKQFLSKEELDDVTKLQNLRNMVAHTTERISATNAAEFAEIAGDMATKFLDRAEALRLAGD